MENLSVKDKFDAVRENMHMPLSDSEIAVIIKKLVKSGFDEKQLSKRLGISENKIEEILSNAI